MPSTAEREREGTRDAQHHGEGKGTCKKFCLCDGFLFPVRLDHMRHLNPRMTKLARSMRNVPSAAENKLWQILRNRQVDGLKFVRQEPIGPFIADFVCRSCRLVIEVDGPSHDEPGADDYDARRSAFLVGQGYRVLRFSNEQVLGDLGPVLEVIKDAAELPSPSP